MANNLSVQRGFKTQAEKISEDYRYQMGLTVNDPLDAFSLAEFLSIPIFTVDDAVDPEFIALREKLNNTNLFNALWMPNVDGDKLIIHNQNHSLKRQQSNLMHELAHIIRNHETPTDIAILCHQYNLHYFNKEHEDEARYLGGCLQIGRQGLLNSLKQKKSKEEISEQYNASLEMVNYRVNATGVMKQINRW